MSRENAEGVLNKYKSDYAMRPLAMIHIMVSITVMFLKIVSYLIMI